MNFTLTQVFILGVGYLAILFTCAWLAEKKLLPASLIKHPLTYILAVGVYASAWAFYGSFGFAHQYGYGYLTYYLGIAGAFVLAPILLVPFLRLARTYRLTSLADLLAFRYRSRWVGILVTLSLLIGCIPLLALQIQTIGDVIHLLTNESSPYQLALAFCAVITLFAILFGARNTSLHERNESLLVVLALESLVKLVIFLILGAVALVGVFNGLDGLESWLADNSNINLTSQPLENNQWQILILLFFATALTMPHIFHIIFTENPSEEALLSSSWILPSFLFLLALPVPIVYWAHQALGSNLPIEYASLALGNTWALLAFIMGLAAASGTLIVMTLALAPMVVNHLVLSVYQPPAHFDLYLWLVQVRRLLIASIIFIAYMVYLIVDTEQGLTTLGLPAFIATFQLLPGTLAVLYWPSANRKGFITGLLGGLSIWFIGLGLPSLFNVQQISLFGYQLALQGIDDWYLVTLIATGVNLFLFVLVSLSTPPSEEEKVSALTCSQESIFFPQRHQLQAQSTQELIQQLSLPLGSETAHEEVNKALQELHINPKDHRPFTLRRLRGRIQANLSGLMGSAVAQEIVDRYLPWQSQPKSSESDIHYMEHNLEVYRTRLTGMAKELDKLRRYHRQTLMHLPLGICTLGKSQEILMWNLAMSRLTGLNQDSVLGLHVHDLPTPWQDLITSFLASPSSNHQRQALTRPDGSNAWISLHKTLQDDPATLMGGTILLLEDQSNLKLLEEELIHKERLASIGRLAAGVAHEIGNPVTGISSLAQNLVYDAEDPQLIQETSQQILHLTQRITSIVQSLVNFAHAGRRSNKQEFITVNLHGAIQEAINLISLSRKGSNRSFTNLCPPDLHISGDTQRLVQVFVNLIGNACDATQEGGEILCLGYTEDQTAIIEIHDNGQGLSTADMEHLFEPFYTTKEAGKGTGLGLALVYSIVEEHQGHILALSPSPKFSLGSCFRCHFPLPRQNLTISGATP